MASDQLMTVQPYIFFDGRCEEALEFYQKAVGAKVEALMRFKENPDGTAHNPPGTDDKVMHANFRIGNTQIMASDGMAGGAPKFDGFALTIHAKDEAEADRQFNALLQGGEVTMPLAKTFFAVRFGMLRDKFGVHWMVMVPLPLG